MTDSLVARYSVSPEVVESKVGNEMVLLHLGSGTYFSLDVLGTRIWEALKVTTPLPAICATIAGEFRVPVDQVEDYTRALLTELTDHQIIVETQ